MRFETELRTFLVFMLVMLLWLVVRSTENGIGEKHRPSEQVGSSVRIHADGLWRNPGRCGL
jgi:hypothetical protein